MIDQDGIKIKLKLIDKNTKILQINLGGYVDQANVHHLQQTITDCVGRQIIDIRHGQMNNAAVGCF